MMQISDGEKSTRPAVLVDASAAGRQRPVAAPRQLTNEDRGSVLAHLLRLSDLDRRMRFCQAFSDANIDHYVANIDFEASACFGLFDERGDLIALVQSFLYADAGLRMIEAAFSTDAPRRCQGLGTALFREVNNYAAVQRADRVVAQCLAGNRPMRALLRAVGAVCEVDDGEVTAQLEVVGHA